MGNLLRITKNKDVKAKHYYALYLFLLLRLFPWLSSRDSITPRTIRRGSLNRLCHWAGPA